MLHIRVFGIEDAQRVGMQAPQTVFIQLVVMCIQVCNQFLPIGSALFTATQQKVLGLLYATPERSYYTKEIIRLTGMGVATIKRELDRMTGAGILTLTRIGNQHHYQANPECPIYAELISIVEKIMNTGNMAFHDRFKLSKASLAKLAKRHHIQRLSLFGSAARGEMTEDSDIDLQVEFEEGNAPSLGSMVNISDDFSALFGGRKVDLATPSILNNPYRKRATEDDMEVLYATK